MIFLSVLFKAYALFWGLAHWPAAAACWIVGVGIDVVYWKRTIHQSQERKHWRVWTDVLVFNVGAWLAGCTAFEVLDYAAMRWKDGMIVASNVAGFLLRAMGLSVGVFEGQLHMTTMSGPLTFAVSLDHLGLWIPVGMVSGYAVYLLLTATSIKQVLRSMAAIVGILAGASLLRLAMAVGLFLFLCDFVSYETEELPWGPFVKPSSQAWMFLPFLLACWPLLSRVSPVPVPIPAVIPPVQNRMPFWMPLLGLLVSLTVMFWEPQGRLKNGKVLINTFHTQWSRTDRPYDREWYGADSGYNYACLKRWFEVFYDVRELKERIQARDLDGISVLIIFVPDQPFSDEERRLILEFVRGGGGLFLIGDHTNVFGSTSHLNETCGDFGFYFRDDVLFDLDDDFFQLFDTPRLPSAFLHGMPFFKFRGPTSIQPTRLSTRTVIALDHAKSLRAIYSVNNFYPPPHDHPQMRCGRFCVSVASRFGQGRVVAFADSTVFSNFEIFYPGKYEYLLNVAHWLNHQDGYMGAFVRRCCLVAAILILGWLLVRNQSPRGWLRILVSALIVLHLARLVGLAIEHHRSAFPAPLRPVPALFLLAQAKDPVYGLREFASQMPYDQRYDVLAQWILRTGALSGFLVTDSDNSILFNHLNRSQKDKTALALIVRGAEQIDYLKKLMRDTKPPCNRWLLLFSKKLDWETIVATLKSTGIAAQPGILDTVKTNWPAGEMVVRDGSRRFVLVFSAERFSDMNMGFSEKVVPNEIQRSVFNQFYAIIDRLFDDRFPDQSAATPIRATPPSQ